MTQWIIDDFRVSLYHLSALFFNFFYNSLCYQLKNYKTNLLVLLFCLNCSTSLALCETICFSFGGNSNLSGYLIFYRGRKFLKLGVSLGE